MSIPGDEPAHTARATKPGHSEGGTITEDAMSDETQTQETEEPTEEEKRNEPSKPEPETDTGGDAAS